MRWIRYQANGAPVSGIVEGDEVIEVRSDPFSSYRRMTLHRPLSSVKLLVPVEPCTFYCAVLNYAEHFRAKAAVQRPLGRECLTEARA